MIFNCVRRTQIALFLGAVSLAVTAVTSCGPPARAVVTGNVTLNKQPLTGGTISFVASKSVMGTAVINADGSYAVNDAPIGDVTITVTTPEMPQGLMQRLQKPAPGMQMPTEMQPPGMHSGPPVKIVPAPDKYKSVEYSPLKFTVQPGSQTHDIELTP